MRKAVSITLIYLAFGFLWIYGTDFLVFQLFGDDIATLESLQNIKGFLYVFLSALLVFSLILYNYNGLIQNREEMDTVFRNSEICLLKADKNGIILDVSDNIQSILGFSREELLGKKLEDITPEEYWVEDRENVNSIKRGEFVSYSIEKEYFHKDGSRVPLRLNGSSRVGNNGVKYYITLIQDLRKLREAEISLKQEQDKLENLAKNLPGLLVRYRMKMDGEIYVDYVNGKIGNAWGLREKTVKSRNDLIWGVVDNKTRETLKRSMKKSAKSFNTWKEEWQISRENGEKAWLSAIGRPHKDEENNELIWDTVILDITQAKENEEHLQLLEKVVINSREGIVLCYPKNVDPEYKWPVVTYMNKAAKELSGKAELKEKDIRLNFLFGPKTSPDVENQILNCLQERKDLSTRLMLYKQDGTSLWAQISLFPVNDSSGEVLRWVLMITDITDEIQQELNTTNAILKAIDKEREAMAMELHDSLTQNLSVVSLNFKNAAHEVADLSKTKRYARGMEYLSRSIEQSRNISHRLMPKSIKDFGLIASTHELVDDLNKLNDLSISFDYNRDVRLTEEIELNLFRIIQEALTNIRLHSGAKEAKIILEVEDSELSLKITDNGKGFSESAQKKGKEGIGLKTIRNRVVSLDGNLSIQSTGQKGTTVLISIPLNKMEPND